MKALLGRYQQEYKQKKGDAFPGNGKQPGLRAENQRLRAELRPVQLERDIIKRQR